MNATIKAIVIAALKAEGISPELITEGSFVVEHPADLSKGDYSTNAALSFAKVLKKNPVELAKGLVGHINENLSADISKVEMAGPGFINFFLSVEFLNGTIKEIVEKGGEFGKGNVFEGQTWAIEYGSPNPNKAMHLGHLRNVITGVAICNLLEASGAKVVREMVDNDRGIAIAKVMLGYLVKGRSKAGLVSDIEYWSSHKDDWHTPESYKQKADRFIDDMYVAGSTEFDQHPEQQQVVRDLVVCWENEDPIVMDLWRLLIGWSHEGQKETLDRLGATYDFVWHESDHYKEGKRYVEEGLQKGVFKKLEDGAILTDLEAMGLSDTIVQKNDGTSLYITQDLALTDLKKKKHKADHLIWVIGPDQSLALQQLFAVCEQLGIGKREEFTHIPYGYVTIKGLGKMSSRKGTVIFADDVLDEVKEKTEELMKERISDDMERSEIAEIIAHGALAYQVLKPGRTKDVDFDINSALSFEGDSGPYLQYAHTRALSVLRKAKEEGIEVVLDGHHLAENDLMKKLYRLPEVVEESAKLFAPQLMVTYLTDLAATFNNFYAHNQVVVEGDEMSGKRVALVAAYAEVMKNGLAVLGIKVPERM